MRPKLTYANVTSTLALVMAVAGGSYAATRSAEPNGLIHGCVGRDGRLVVVKAGRPCRGGATPIAFNRQGPTGVAGAPGAQGPTGSQGARGPSDAYFASNPSGATGSASVSLKVPPGDYLADGGCDASQQLGVRNGSARALLSSDNDTTHSDGQVATVPYSGLTLGVVINYGRVTLASRSGFHLPAGGTITLTCSDEPGSDVTGMPYDNLRLTAIAVDTLHG